MHENTIRLVGAGFLIRPVAAADNAALAGLLREVMEEFGAAGAGTSHSRSRDAGHGVGLRRHGSAYFVVEHDRRLVGGGGLGPLAGGAPEVCELRKMYLRPEARGRGLGSRDARALPGDAARQLGYQRMYLETRQNMSEARRLYERNGFTPVGKPLGHTGHFGCDAWYVRDL